MLLASIAILVGLVLLIWSADRFIEGASASARHLGMPPLLIGMVIIGFGTSAPEMVVSVLAASAGNPGLALGNAYGSNIVNIAVILGLTALLAPITVNSSILRRELPLLAGVTLLAGWQLRDNEVSRLDAGVLLLVFFVIFAWTIRQGMKNNTDVLEHEVEETLESNPMSLKAALGWLLLGLVVLVLSSRVLVWGAVEVAQALGVSDLVIGLTIVAVGTSLPELASSLAAIRKKQHDMALGNILGSNLFNTLAVVGLAGSIQPMIVGPEVFRRDVMLTGALTVALFILCYSRGQRSGRINRVEGGLLLLVYVAYITYLFTTAF